jgi:hypothetical protein
MTNKDKKPKLIFVYNADSGFKNLMIDAAHKIFSPKTYPCKLCDLTYGKLGERKAWKKFRQQANAEMKFLHADEFEHLYKSKFRPAFQLPVVLVEEEYELDVLLSDRGLDEIDSLKELMTIIQNFIENHKAG